MECIKGYEGSYAIDRDGEVYSLDRKIETVKGNKRVVLQRKLKPKDNGSGYLFVTLSKRGVTKNFYIHRLVAEAFLHKENEGMVVNHKDGNPSNNHVDNLEWVSHAENVKHAYDTKLNSNQGKLHFFACGVVDNQLEQSFDTIKEWAEARGINYATARNVMNGYSSLKELKDVKIIKLNRNDDE